MLTLGLICYQGHSSSVALLKDGQVLLAVSEERFSRKKHDDNFPIKSIEYLLKEFQLDINQIDNIAIAWSIKKTFIGQLKNINANSFRFIFDIRNGGNKRSRFSKFIKLLNLKSEIKKRLKFRGPIHYVDHHLSHAMCSFVQSKFKDAVVFVADGMGEINSTTIFHFSAKGIKKIYADKFPHSIGIFYSAGTQFLNFEPDSDEFKVMGLAAYGKSSKYINLIKKLYYFENNHFKLNSEYFEIHKSGNHFISENYKELMGKILTENEKMDFAFALQQNLEEIIFKIIKQNNLNQFSNNFCSAGGVFLNCLVNQRIRAEKIFKNAYFFPVPDDNGTCIGAAQVLQKNKFELLAFNNLYLGSHNNVPTNNLDSRFQKKAIVDTTELATLISDGKIMAIMNERMEFGHRALGNRSIVADPRHISMKEILNSKIKYREEYRPFAPCVLEEFADEYFELVDGANYYSMIETAKAKEKAHQVAPAVVHADGTSRIQIVKKEYNENLHQLLNAFYKITNCPILINTSFNLNGMPIVENLNDALVCLDNSEIDYLWIGNELIWKK